MTPTHSTPTPPCGARILVCGGRDYGASPTERQHLCRVLDDLKPAVIISGAARGADRLAATWAKRHGVTLREYPADWKHEGRAAGIRRNARMHDTERPDYVVAFPGGRGTAHMVRYARRRGTPVHHA